MVADSSVFSQTYADFFKKIGQTHVPTLSISVIVIVVILAVKLFVDPYLLRKFHTPFPIEIVAVIACIVLSKTLDFKHNGIKTVDNIPNRWGWRLEVS